MKLQSRKGVFETNSSSVHTLSIQKTKMDFDWDKFGTNGVVELGKTTTKELETLLGKTVLNITELPMQTKLDLLFYSQLSKELTRDFVEGVCLITKFLNEKGFKVVLNYFNAMDNSGYLHWMISSRCSRLHHRRILQYQFLERSYPKSCFLLVICSCLHWSSLQSIPF